MRVVKKGTENEIICPSCKSTLLYENTDVQLVGNMEGEYFYSVKCPQCKNIINVKI